MIKNRSIHIIKYHTTVMSLISKNDESAYREDVEQLIDWCRDSSLALYIYGKIPNHEGPHLDHKTICLAKKSQ